MKTSYLDGLAGTDTLSFGQLKLAQVTITQTTSGTIKVDTVSGASTKYNVELKDIETLKFDKEKNTIDLATYFDGITVTGTAAAETLIGSGGNDILNCKGGSDKLTGGSGADIFVFGTLESGKYVSITDFADDDVLQFDTSVFTKLAGATAENLVLGSKALQSDDYLIYNNGKLYYDADGSGKGKAIQIAGIKGTDYKTLSIDDMHFV
jgi:Ca2+-binding RTX toxin-like protein